MRQGTVLFRAKWTAKEIYIHTRAFGIAAGARYAVTRLRELERRSAKPWDDAASVAPGLEATVLIGPDLQAVMAWGAPVLQAGRDSRAAATLIPLARTVVFAGWALPPNVPALLRSCQSYGVTVCYVYRTESSVCDQAIHNQLLRASQAAVCILGGAR